MTGTLAPSRRLLPARRLGTPPPNATIVARADLGPTMARYAVVPDDGVPPFEPGQYFALGIEIGGRLVQRPYSAASAALDPALEFAIRLVPDGSLTPALWRLGPRDRVRIGPPKGLFRLAGGDGPQLLIATGTGIAPLVAMARALRSQGVPARAMPPRRVVVHGVARGDELAFHEELADWAAATPGWTFVPAVSRPAEPANAGWRGRTGRLDALVPPLLEELGIDPRSCQAYLCGNPAMIVELSARLASLGVPVSGIRAEPY